MNKNYEIIKTLQHSDTPEKLLVLYNQSLQKKKRLDNPCNHFKLAMQVFFYRIETQDPATYESPAARLAAANKFWLDIQTKLKSKVHLKQGTLNGSLQLPKKMVRFSPIQVKNITRYQSRVVQAQTRFAKPFTSGNIFLYLQDEVEELEPPVPRAKRPAPPDSTNQVKKPKVQHKMGNTAKFGKNILDSKFDDNDEDVIIRTRTNKESTTELRRLAGRLTETWHVGVLSAKMKHLKWGRHLQDTIQKIVQAMNALIRYSQNLIRYSQKATDFIIHELIKLNSPDDMVLLDEILSVKKGDGGVCFWSGILLSKLGLMNFIFSGTMRVNTASNLLKKIYQWPEMQLFCFGQQEEYMVEYIHSQLIEMNAQNVAKDFRGAIVGKLPLLIAHVTKNGFEDRAMEIMNESADDIDLVL